MVQGKKVNDMSNGTPKYQSNMSFQRKDLGDARGGSSGKMDGRPSNGNASSFRTDTAISGARNGGERTLQRWVPDAPAETDTSLKSGAGGPVVWDQFAENKRLFGLTTDYDENIYTTTIDKSHPQYKQRLAEAERKAREITNSQPMNSHVAEERVTDNVAGEDGVDEEDKYSGVRRNQDAFPPLTSSNNKYTPPARRAPTGQATVSGAPVDPAIISAQLARPDKPASEKPKAQVSKPVKADVTPAPPSTNDTSAAATPEPKPIVEKTVPSSSRTVSPQVKTDGVPNATATVERDVTTAFKNFAASQRKNVDQIRQSRARNDKEIKLNDLKKFADSFKLNTPVPSDLVSIIAKDPAKQKEIQEKAKRNAEEARANPSSEAVKPVPPPSEARPAPRPTVGSHGTSPSNLPGRQNASRNSPFSNQTSYNGTQSFRGPSQSSQGVQSQSGRTTGTLGARLREREHNKQSQPTLNPIPINDIRLPPTGPANSIDPNFSRRSSGVASVQGARLNPNSSEFRPSPHAATFSPNGNPSTGSSPKSAANPVAAVPISRSLLYKKPIAEADRPSMKGKFNALEHIKTFKPSPGKSWDQTEGMKPAYDTPPTWKQPSDNEPEGSNMHLTYSKLFEMQPYPPQPLSSPNPSHAMPTQVAHQHQLPFHLQQGSHNMASRQSPRQPPMNVHGNPHGQGPIPPFNGHDDHRMMPSHSAQSYASPRMQPAPMGYPSPMGQPAQLAYNAQMMPYAGAPAMQGQYRSLSQSQFNPPTGHMGPIMMTNPAGTFLTSQGMPPGPPIMYPQGNQGPFMQPGNGLPPVMPGVNGFPSPGRGAPMMMSQGSQQGHQQPMYGMTPGMSPGPQYGTPIYAQQPPGQMPMRGYGVPNQFGTSPQQLHQFAPQQHRNNHPNGSYNSNAKNFQPHNTHQNGPPNVQAPTGPQARIPDGNEDAK